MMADREKDQADFDLERFIDMFDEALTSKDERVINALRQLMMMVILTKPEAREQSADRNSGPLRRLIDDVHNIHRRLGRLEDYQERARYHESATESYKWPAQTQTSVWNATTYGQGKTPLDIATLHKQINTTKGK